VERPAWRNIILRTPWLPQVLIDAERKRLSTRARVDTAAPLAARKQAFFSEFRDYTEIMDYAGALLAEPAIETRALTIGESREGNPITTFEFTGAGGLAKPAVYLQGSAHANEWMGTMGCLFAMTELIEGYAAGRNR
jgi:hypothetical protein